MQGIKEIVREAPFGQLLRYMTRNRVLLYPEEQANFQIPDAYTQTSNVSSAPASIVEKVPSPTAEISTSHSCSSDISSTADAELARDHAPPWTAERLAADAEIAKHDSNHHNHHHTHAVVPAKTPDGIILADWYTTDDPANPLNWSRAKKTWTAFLICLYTFVVYAGSSIYVSSVMLVMERFQIPEFKASLGLALYVLGYGLGPMIFAPLSEVPQLGRNIPYITSFAVFTILALPTSLVDDFGGLLFLRFLLGYFGSPCLANGGASMQDIYSLLYLPYGIMLWVGAAFMGPALGPLLSSYSVYAKSWRWSQWEILWASAPVFLLLFFFLPETQPTTILLHRSARLRHLTSNPNIHTQTEIDNRDVKFSATLLDAIVKPLEIGFKDPALAFINIYSMIMYGIYYTYFEVFPLVYIQEYGFTVGEMSLVFLSIIIGCILGIAIYSFYLKFYLTPDILKRGLRAQEHRLVPAMFASFGVPIGLFVFGWTARRDVHWLASATGIVIYAACVFIIFQAITSYIPMSYPKYAASLFAGNDFCRSLFAFGAVLFGRPMYVNLGVDKGISLLGGLSVSGIIGMYLIWVYGARLRAKSKFAV